jgi:programmed cell death protein 5
MASEEELEELRRRRMYELQRRLAEEQSAAEAKQQLELQKQSILRRILTSEARQRLTNLKMVKPEFAEQLELQLIQVAQTGRIRLPVTDDQLKQMLLKLQSQRRDITIRRI